jgi:effector-binding domain-containing protein/uncharacterized protein YndB with AHSA1/START domain
MRILKYFLILVLIVLVAASIYLASLDGTYDVKRTRLIKADPEVVFNDLNDYRNWAEWGPWYEQDSTIAVTYSDKTMGEGAFYSWTSDEGDGEMRTLHTQPYERIDSEILFKTPFGEMASDLYWILKETEEGTELTWGIKGEMPFLTRFMAGGMEEQMGPMEERGLELFDENLQRKLKVHSIEGMGIVDYSGGFYLYVSASSRISDLNDRFGPMMEEVSNYAKEKGIRLTGSPFAIYHKYDVENGTSMFSVGYPVSERIITEAGSNVLTGFMDRGRYYKTVLKGSYSYSGEAWDYAMSQADQVEGFRLDEAGEPFEIYAKLPADTPNPAELVTEIYVPVIRKSETTPFKNPDV